MALPCYADGERELARLIDDEMQAGRLDHRAGRARGAHALSRRRPRGLAQRDLRKLALYAQNSGEVTLDDVLAVVADASTLALDNVVDAAFAGKTAEVETQFAKARAAGTAPGTIALAALRQVSNLHRLRLSVDDGSSVSEAVARARPPVHFRRQAVIETALRNWTSERLAARHGAIVGSRVRNAQTAGARRSRSRIARSPASR